MDDFFAISFYFAVLLSVCNKFEYWNWLADITHVGVIDFQIRKQTIPENKQQYVNVMVGVCAWGGITLTAKKLW